MESEVKFSTVIKNRYGLHLRPATMIAGLARRYDSTIAISCRGLSAADARNPMELLALAVESGVELQITIRGKDAEAASQELRELIDSAFGDLQQ